MRVLLAAINAKYIHSNLAVYSLQAYVKKQVPQAEVQLGEYTINHQMDLILQDIYKRKPDVIGFSCYIWNIQYVKAFLRDIPKVLPKVEIWLGGPEVSYRAREILEQYPAVCGVMVGEGEATLAELVSCYCEWGDRAEDKDLQKAAAQSEETKADWAEGICEKLGAIKGIVFRNQDHAIMENPRRELMDMSELPFPYSDLKDLEHRIIYYESSRGCPFSCSYCLSSIDKAVRFRSLKLVKQELDFFLERKVPQVKFVDRTFNCKKSHALEIWKYLNEHDNGVTNFHFEVSADLIDEEELAVMKTMRPGLIQLEIGVQTTNPQTIAEIRRKMNLERLREVVGKIDGFHNIHQHLDLIAGLPYEDFDSFCRSFDEVYRMRPEQLQLGFLKVLAGSYMAEQVGEYGLLYHDEPPYEVLATNWMSYEEILKLKLVEEMVEAYYNSGQFTKTLRFMEQYWQSPYVMFEELGQYCETHGIPGASHSRLSRYERLFDFLKQRLPELEETYRDLLMYDLYLRENVKSRPSFARDLGLWKTQARDFFQNEEKAPVYLKGYEGYDSRQMSKMAHLEMMGDGALVLFDYRNRDPLTYNAKATRIGEYGV